MALSADKELDCVGSGAIRAVIPNETSRGRNPIGAHSWTRAPKKSDRNTFDRDSSLRDSSSGRFPMEPRVSNGIVVLDLEATTYSDYG